ncbi:MAG: FCD domain-containing protein, partial [Hyphomicrobiales bacterium]
CAMPRLIAHIDVLGVAADRYLRMTIGALEYAEKSHAEHRELLAACLARDEARAISCLTKHIYEASTALVALIDT